MIIVKRFTSEQNLSDYLTSNRQYEVLSRVGIAGTVVLLSDNHQNTSAVEAVDEYIDGTHYEHSSIHYKAYYGEY
jgi:hypothetical protein